jgi:hypothetical protein
MQIEQVHQICISLLLCHVSQTYCLAGNILWQLDVARARALLIGPPHCLSHIAWHQAPMHQLHDSIRIRLMRCLATSP